HPMCSNYRPVTDVDRLLTFFGVDKEPGETTAPEVWPLGLAPFIRAAEEGSGNKRVDDGLFGMIASFAKELAYGRKTYNARSETVHETVTFKGAWAKGWRCIIPAECIYEPCYETGKAVRWRIQGIGGSPLGVAGIYRPWKAPDGRMLWTFSMLTVNGEGHPVFKRMHRPEDEKRMVLILSPDKYDDWLGCSVEEARRYFKQWAGPLETFAEPLPPRAPKASSVRTTRPRREDQGSFDGLDG
ncbi:MAG: SOS response-associated peptidase family protein, partial [Blastocatellia bacterium]|nr:SOS response-associated peptidase family protein [Blastocatellia bacterium]